MITTFDITFDEAALGKPNAKFESSKFTSRDADFFDLLDLLVEAVLR